MKSLVASRPVLNSRIFPFMGGRELNTDPRHNSDRFIINFGDETEDEVRATFPELMAIVEEKLWPQREAQKNLGWAKKWWQYGGSTAEVAELFQGLNRILANSQVSAVPSFAFQPADIVFAHTRNVFALDTYSGFCALQSRSHEVWSRFFGSSMKDDLRYTATDCFDTYPFPLNWKPHNRLEEVGKAYYEHRAQLMIANDEGLTKTYNRFHDPHEKSSEIAHLHELHAAMDRVVLEAYGCDDLAQSARCEFLLDYEEEDDDEPGAKKSKKKKPWRLRWPDDFRDEVLARLLELNEQRHQDELLAGKAGSAAAKGNRKPKSKKNSPENVPAAGQADLFEKEK